MNIERLNYLLALYRMSKEDLLTMLNKGRTKIFHAEDIFTDDIELSILKKIDSIFGKSIFFFMDFSPLKQSKEASVFFRKQNFETDLNLESKKIVDRFESLKLSLDTYSTLADIKVERRLPVYHINDNPKDVAAIIRNKLYPENRVSKKRELLKELINRCATYNIYVFEFIETWNKKEKANIDGFFICPNVIVLKRHQEALSRELFSFAHELGHCLLEKEEIESIDVLNIVNKKTLGLVEHWCNDFAFFFLMGNAASELDKIVFVGGEQDYCHDVVLALSRRTLVSRLAIYTRLYLDKKMAYSDYQTIKDDILYQYEQRKEKQKKKKLESKGGRTPQPILSNLYVDTLQCAYYKGVIDEMDFCKSLHIKPNKIGDYLRW